MKFRMKTDPVYASHQRYLRAARKRRRIKKFSPAQRTAFHQRKRMGKYGINVDTYNSMFLSQKGVCAICGQPETKLVRDKISALAVDHCHSTGKVRGLLCVRCNMGIGHFKDSLEVLEAAYHYLRGSTLGVEQLKLDFDLDLAADR